MKGFKLTENNFSYLYFVHPGIFLTFSAEFKSQFCWQQATFVIGTNFHGNGFIGIRNWELGTGAATVSRYVPILGITRQPVAFVRVRLSIRFRLLFAILLKANRSRRNHSGTGRAITCANNELRLTNIRIHG